eukprot:TRINITY_DN8159_c0_g1_i1.p1 TRINITY_DN8159_c0_g1~~TRINITY_DN8159_c0_g1_i1.p1  ORF type:complete len:865 (-),score=142.82 TRINITY_DN8159_c0_g1_i1:145-2739(-)
MYYNDIALGSFDASILFFNVPILSQMEGGVYNDSGICDATPLVPGIPFPKTADVRKFLYSNKREKSKRNDVIWNQKLDRDCLDRIQTNIKYLQKDDVSSKEKKSISKEIYKILEKNNDPFPRVPSGVLYDIVRLLFTRKNKKAESDNLCRGIIACTRNRCNVMSLLEPDSFNMIIGSISDPRKASFKSALEILKPLSIHDSAAQKNFQDEGLISILISHLNSGFKSSTVKTLATILGNLAYGVSGESNREVIRYEKGVNALVKAFAQNKSSSLRNQITLSLNYITFDNDENVRTLINGIIATLNKSKVEDKSLLLNILHTFLEKSKGTGVVQESAKNIINTSGEFLIHSLVSEDHDIVKNILRKQLFPFVKEELLGKLSQEIFNAKEMEQIRIAEFLAELLKETPMGTQYILGNESPFLSKLLKLFSTLSSNDVYDDKLYPILYILENTTMDEKLLAQSQEDITDDIIHSIIGILSTENSKLQNICLNILVNISKVPSTYDILVHSDVFSIIMGILSNTESMSHQKESSLKLVAELLKSSDINMKTNFYEMDGLNIIKELILSQPDIAIQCVYIIDAICFPTTEKTQTIIMQLIEMSIIDSMIAQLKNPNLFERKPHILIGEILTTLNHLSSIEEMKEILLEDDFIDLVCKISSQCNGEEAKNLLSEFGYISRLCSSTIHGHEPVSQLYASCESCGIGGEHGLCRECVETCHFGHQLNITQEYREFACQCGTSQYCVCKECTKSPEPINVCSFSFTNRTPMVQQAFQCKYCHSTPDKYVCHSCVKSCHSEHLPQYVGMIPMVCACGSAQVGCRLGDTNDEAQNNDRSVGVEDECVICMMNPMDCVIVPCGHIGIIWKFILNLTL